MAQLYTPEKLPQETAQTQNLWKLSISVSIFPRLQSKINHKDQISRRDLISTSAQGTKLLLLFLQGVQRREMVFLPKKYCVYHAEEKEK